MSHVIEGLESNEKGEASLELIQPAPPRDTIAALARSPDKYTALISQCQVIIKLDNAQAVLGKKKKKTQKLHPDTKKPPRVCSAKLGRELTREENPMISVSSSEANLYLLSNGNIWSSSLGNGENRRTRKERQGH